MPDGAAGLDREAKGNGCPHVVRSCRGERLCMRLATSGAGGALGSSQRHVKTGWLRWMAAPCRLEAKMTFDSSRFWFTFRYWYPVAAKAEQAHLREML